MEQQPNENSHASAQSRAGEAGANLTDVLDRLGDTEQTIYSAELYLLRKIAETSSDMVKARTWPEFRDACGGQAKLDAAHEAALRGYEEWLTDGEV